MKLKTAAARRFDSAQQEAYLALWRTYDRLKTIEDELFARFELTAQQYNVLRLLRAEAPEKVPTLQLVKMLVSRAPDITRMLDKLEMRELVERHRSLSDRRSVNVGVTSKGVRLLKEISKPLAECHDRQLGHLSARELKTLIDLLHAARRPHEPVQSPWR